MYTTISNKIDNLEQFCLSLINKMKNVTSVEDLMELKKQWWHKRLEKRLSRFDVRGERRK